MSASQGQPYYPFAGPRISIGALGAAPATEASKGVVVLDSTGVPSPNIIPTGATFQLRAEIRTAVGGPPAFTVPPGTTVEFHVHSLTGAAAPGSPFLGGAIAPMLTPAGDPGPAGVADQVNWYSSTSGVLALANGTYRVMAHVHSPPIAGVTAFHDGTVVYVGP